MVGPAAGASLSGGQKEAAPIDHGSAGDVAHFFDAEQPASSALSASASMATLHQATAQRHATSHSDGIRESLPGQSWLNLTHVPLKPQAAGQGIAKVQFNPYCIPALHLSKCQRLVFDRQRSQFPVLGMQAS